MNPIGPLWREHRLIERVITLLDIQLKQIRTGIVDLRLLDTAIDFTRTYAERLHFKKEEDIYFAALTKKDLDVEFRTTMKELTDEHNSLIGKLVLVENIRSQISSGSDERVTLFSGPIEEMIQQYPEHMIKEDQHFFFPSMEFFTRKESDEMLKQFQHFDAGIIHDKYEKAVVRMEGSVVNQQP